MPYRLLLASYLALTAWLTTSCGKSTILDAALPLPVVQTCPENFVRVDDACIHEKRVDCIDSAPEHAMSVIEAVTLYYHDDSGWDAAPPCEWECRPEFAHEEGICLNQKEVDCFDEAPQNAESTPQLVVVHYSDEHGWSTPESCDWVCAEGYELTEIVDFSWVDGYDVQQSGRYYARDNVIVELDFEYELYLDPPPAEAWNHFPGSSWSIVTSHYESPYAMSMEAVSENDTVFRFYPENYVGSPVITLYKPIGSQGHTAYEQDVTRVTHVACN